MHVLLTFLQLYFHDPYSLDTSYIFIYSFANANVLLVLGELMGQDNDDDGDGVPNRNAIPLIACAIVMAQATMAVATYMGNYCTVRGCGRKPLFMIGLPSLPIRCALIIYWKDAGNMWLLSTQILDGLGGGLFGLLHPYLVADITFGTGRFNLVMGFTASCFGYVNRKAVEKINTPVFLLYRNTLTSRRRFNSLRLSALVQHCPTF
jgi:hypothetical protein